MSTVSDLTFALKAQLPGLHIRSLEEKRAMLDLRRACAEFKENPKVLWQWSAAAGLREIALDTGAEKVLKEPCAFDEAITDLITAQNAVVLALCDPWDELGRAIFQSYLKRGLYAARGSSKCIVLLGRDWQMPPEVQDQIMLVDLALPTKSELLDYITKLAKAYSESENLKGKIKITPEKLPELARACMGLTIDEAKSIVALAIVKFKELNGDAIKMALSEKKQIIARGGILQYEEADKNMDSIGGLQNLKTWIAKRRKLFSDEARAAGINAPKGVLLVGVPGTGKTLCARAIASAWNCPLVRLDAGRLFGSLVGESESNLRRALRTAESVAPCVLMIDELEKAFSQGGGDGGTSQRVFDGLLSWLQDKKADVFVVATANDISKLPPELLRVGRFDSIFFVDLPDEKSRKEILEIQLKRAGAKIETEKAVNISAGYTGAELEGAVQVALIEAFDVEKKPSVSDLISAIKNTVPLSKTMETQINALRQWAASGRAQLAGGTIEVDKVKNKISPSLEIYV